MIPDILHDRANLVNKLIYAENQVKKYNEQILIIEEALEKTTEKLKITPEKDNTDLIILRTELRDRLAILQKMHLKSFAEVSESEYNLSKIDKFLLRPSYDFVETVILAIHGVI